MYIMLTAEFWSAVSVLYVYLIPHKSEVTCALEGEISFISFNEKSVFVTRYVKLHSVAAFHLKGYVIRGGG